VWYSSSVALKTAAPPATLLNAARAAIAGLDKDQAITRVRTMDEVTAEATERPRFRALLVGAFAAIALGFASVGVFGVLTFTVRERMREFGVRVALGAAAGDIVRLVLAQGARVAGAGVLIGLAGAALLTRTLASLLVGVTPLDPVTFVAAPAVLVLSALAACVVPALRAIRVDPAITLRQDG
jgi:putative ABC transport system permease protein